MDNFSRNLRLQIGSEKLRHSFNVILLDSKHNLRNWHSFCGHMSHEYEYSRTTRSDSLISLLTNQIRRVHISDRLSEFMRTPCAKANYFSVILLHFYGSMFVTNYIRIVVSLHKSITWIYGNVVRPFVELMPSKHSMAEYFHIKIVVYAVLVVHKSELWRMPHQQFSLSSLSCRQV